MEKVWNFLNGNKTTIGLVVAFLLSKTWFTGWIGADVAEVLSWISGTFLTVGVAHKLVKSNTSPEPNK